ncbi:ATP-binding protein [Alteraurantiacibacter aquimixticola]|uniref:histidine kinase n=1 Tax=Alteraurantiacibacter aquimixticola TaxID=2489173 RepID=A0A4T3F312_9SPHN|nr:ATP-binding protein [Alteraurantiacibacter aquimixticola]TIX51121.1 response regulator [Alteraurantiacibacter aquimixticola]
MSGSPRDSFNVTTGVVLEPLAPEEQVALLERRLAREFAARAAAENLLEERSRTLAEANNQLELRKADLAASLERRHRQLLEAQKVAGFGTLTIDLRSKRVEISDNAKELVGFASEEEAQSYRAHLRRVVQEDRDQLFRWMKELFGTARQGKCATCPSLRPPADGDARHISKLVSKPRLADLIDQHKTCMGEGQHIEVRLSPRGDEGPRWVRVIAQIEFDHRCRASMLFATIQDITQRIRSEQETEALRARDLSRLGELERLNRELSDAREEAERASDAKSRFLAMMSHDIRTPLNGIVGMMSLLEEEGLTSEQRRSLELARNSGEQLRVLLNDIIDLARAEAGRFDLHPQPTQLLSLIEQRAEFWRCGALEKQLVLETKVTPQVPSWIMIDMVRLNQLLDNLLSNAIKYTNEGGILLSLDYLPSGRLRVEIIDSGVGVPPERRKDLFEEFGQLHMPGSQAGGAGLGLAICRRIAEVMGGEIGVDSADIGSCFWFELPCNPIMPPLHMANPIVDELKGRGGRTPRVLVAEDLTTNQIVVKGMLKKFGCEATIVGNGRDALYEVEAGDYDIVLMDMAMPVMDGATATRAIRELPEEKGRIPIIALTAYARDEELAPMVEAGANACASKPIVSEDLRQKLTDGLATSY